MAHIHLSWELGGGLGHAGRLKMLALALRARGHRVSLSLRDLVHTETLLADLDAPRLQAPVWLHQAVGLPATQGNLAETLFACGYLEPGAVRGLMVGWRSLFQQLAPDLLVADYAPTALLAARSLGLPSVSIGNGFYTPPRGQPLPPLRDWEPIAPARLASSEARLLATANALLAGWNAPPYAHAADIFLGDEALLCTWPELDHYARPRDGARWLGPNFLADAGAAAPAAAASPKNREIAEGAEGAASAPAWPPGAGAKVFAYLKVSHPSHVAVLRALADEGCRTLVYLPEVAGGAAPPVHGPSLRYSATPLPLAAVLADADLCVCHAGEATLAQAMLAGVPTLMLPEHTEQFLLARRIAQAGAGYNAAMLTPSSDWRAALRRVRDQASMRQAARALAARHRGFSQRRMNEELALLLEQTLAANSAVGGESDYRTRARP